MAGGSTGNLSAALAETADRVLHTYDPDRIYKTLGEDLQELGLICAVITADPQTRQIYHEYHNRNQTWLQVYQGLTGKSHNGSSASREVWEKFIQQVFEDGKPRYFEDFHGIVSSLMPVPRHFDNKPLSNYGINPGSKGMFLPLFTRNEIFAFLVVWSGTLESTSLLVFREFSERISPALHFAHLQKARSYQAKQLQRSNALIKALSNISANISASADPEEMLSSLGSELKQFDLDCFVSILDSDRENYQNRYVSIQPELFQQAEKYFGGKILNLSVPREKLEKILSDSQNSQEEYYYTSLQDLLKQYLAHQPGGISKKILQAVRIPPQSPVLILPLKHQDGRIGTIGFWGGGLLEEDGAIYQVFASQVAHIFQNAIMLEKAQQEIQLRKEAQKELEISRQELRGVFENAHDAILLVDPESLEILDVNDRACSVYGYTRDEFTALNLETIHTNQNHAVQLLTKTIQTGACNRFETVHRLRNQETISFEINSSLVQYHGRIAVQCINRDISARKAYEEKLRYDALHDALTNLPNRDLFRNRLMHAIARLSRYADENFAILYIDLDDFKKINDSLGHLAGDRYLIHFAHQLQGIIRESDIAARLGGDEFGVLLEDTHSPESAKQFCSRLLQELTQPLEIDNHEFVVTASIGIVMSSPEHSSPEDYLRNADIAMYESKKRGKRVYTVYSSGMHTGLLKRVSIENKIRHALRNLEFFLEYQPIINLQDQQTSGFEALVRWQDPEDGVIPPADFIPVSEETGLIHSLGTWILDTACSEFQSWINAGWVSPEVTISVNISPAQLMHPNFPMVVEQIIKKSGINPGCLCLEVTETAFITDPMIAEKALQAIHNLGVNIHLDDFGTGYSSLSFLTRFPIDAIKIDRKFILDLGQENNNALVESLILMSRSMGLSLIAEGVETEDQLAILSGMSCEKAQGYYFSKPVAADLLQSRAQARCS